VHAKTGTVDGLWSTIGTANIDRLSLAGNYEVNMEILDPHVARRMEEIFLLDSGNCTELTLEEWLARPMINRVTEGIPSPWRPLLSPRGPAADGVGRGVRPPQGARNERPGAPPIAPAPTTSAAVGTTEGGSHLQVRPALRQIRCPRQRRGGIT